VYTCCFIAFCTYYFTAYQDEIGFLQNSGYDRAITYALEQYDKDSGQNIYVTKQIRHSQVLFATEYVPYDFIESNEWEEYPARWLSSKSFGPFTWDEALPGISDICIIMKTDFERYEATGYVVKQFDQCGVACRKK